MFGEQNEIEKRRKKRQNSGQNNCKYTKRVYASINSTALLHASEISKKPASRQPGNMPRRLHYLRQIFDRADASA